jgi:hypothetical protein
MACSSRLKAALIGVMCLAAGLGTISCDSRKGREGKAAPPEQVGVDSVTAYVDIRERGYAALEPIPIKEPAWTWSEGRTFAEAAGRVMIAPGDSLVYEYTWDGRLADGSLPRLGRYRVKGALMTAPPIETGMRKFAIVD